MSLIPRAMPETQPFWDGADKERLIIQHCPDCERHYFPPGPVCPRCTSRNVTWGEISGRATLYSYVIAEASWPQWGVTGPMTIAMVELEEGPRLISAIMDCDPRSADLMLDMPLVAVWRRFEDRRVLCFKPAPEPSS